MTFKVNRITWAEVALQGAILILLLAALFPATFSKGEIILPGGMLLASPPWNAYAPEGFEPPANWLPQETLIQTHCWFELSTEAIKDGDWPFWNHLQYGGTPLLANYQSAVFFPLRLLHLFLDINTATTVYFLLRLWLCGIFTYLCARTFGLSGLASSFASLAYTASSYNITWMYWPLPGIAAFLPLAVMGAEYLVQRRYTRGFFTFSLAATMLMLAGHPETQFTGCFGMGLYFIIRLISSRRSGGPAWKPILAISAAWALVLSVCAVQIFPFLEYVPNSHAVLPSLTRASASEYALPVATGVLFFVPRFFGLTADNTFWLDHPENSNLVAFIYPGIAVWFTIALLAAKGAWKTSARRRVIALAACVVIESLLAFDIELLAPLHRLPLFEWVWQRYHMTFVMLALPLLGAFGIDHWLKGRRSLRDLGRPALCLGLPVVCVASLYAFYHTYLVLEGLDQYVLRQILIAAGLLGICSLALLTHLFARRGTRALKAALCIIVCVDLTLAARDLLPTAPRAWMYPPTKLTSAIQELPKPNRFSVFSADISPGLLQMYGIEQLWGSDGISPYRILRFLDEAYPKYWDRMEPLCSVNYYLFRADSRDVANMEPRFRHIMTFDGIHVMKNTLAYDRAFLVPRLEVIENVDELFDRMQLPDYDPRALAVTEIRPRDPLPEASAKELGTAVVTQRSRNELTVEVDASQRCLLVVTDAYYPGWRAYDNGTPAELLPTYHAFRGVIVDAGKHTVTFRMEPTVFYQGLAVSCVALGGGMVLSIWAITRRRAAGRKKGRLADNA